MQPHSAMQDLLPKPQGSGRWDQSPRVTAATPCQWEMSPPNPPGTGRWVLTLILISGFWM